MPSPQLVCLKWYDARFFLFKYFPSHFFDGLLPWILFSLVPLLLIESTDKLLRHIFQHTNRVSKIYIYIYIFLFGEGWNIGRCLFVFSPVDTWHVVLPLPTFFVYRSVCTKKFLSLLSTQWHKKGEGESVILFVFFRNIIHHTVILSCTHGGWDIFHL